MIKKQDLGREVVDLVTGLKGIVTSWHENLGGIEQAGVTGEATGDKPGEIQCYDIVQLDVVAGGRVVPKVDAPKDRPFNLGDEVREVITGFKGKIIEFTTFLNGCCYAVIQPPVDPSKPGKWPERVQLAFPRIELVKKVEAPIAKPKTGGPSRAVMARS